ncbi:MAG TPA: hypothetical protein VMV15_07040 [Candidatus Binataceae bacterium]|nr:hypothetical protein [Candidatus Binataceae bacterium]
MNEGVPVRTIAMMVIGTVVVAAIVAFFMIHCYAPSHYNYGAKHASRSAYQSAIASVQSQTGAVATAVAADA